MLMGAGLPEVANYIEHHSRGRDECGRVIVVRDGRARARQMATCAGVLTVKEARVNDRPPEQRCTSSIRPAYLRRGPKLEETLPVLYRRVLSTDEVGPTLAVLLEEPARGFSSRVITRLKQTWEREYRTWETKDRSPVHHAYAWAGAVDVPVRLEGGRLTYLALVGAAEEGREKTTAQEDGYRESTESYLDVLRELKARGLGIPVLAGSPDSLGLWNALEQILPSTDRGLCWKHLLDGALDKVPKRPQTAATAHL